MLRCRNYTRPTAGQILDFESSVLTTLEEGTLTTKELAQKFDLETNVCLTRLHKMIKKELIGVKRSQRSGNQWYLTGNRPVANALPFTTKQKTKPFKYVSANDSNGPKTRLIPGLITGAINE